jgi:uncharacterized protein (DUF2267 family)
MTGTRTTPKRATRAALTNAARDDAAEVKALRAVELRLAGLTFPQIAQALEYADKSGAKRAYERGLAAMRDDLAPSVAQHRTEQLLRLERLIRAAWPAATDSKHPDHYRAQEAVRKHLERQARLLGLDAPTVVQVSDDTDLRIEALLEEMRELERRRAAADA